MAASHALTAINDLKELTDNLSVARRKLGPFAVSGDRALSKHIDQAYSRLDEAKKLHTSKNYDGASASIGTAAEHIKNAGALLSSAGSEDFWALNAGRLGLAQNYHLNYQDAVNKGKNNGSK